MVMVSSPDVVSTGPSWSDVHLHRTAVNGALPTGSWVKLGERRDERWGSEPANCEEDDEVEPTGFIGVCVYMFS